MADLFAIAKSLEARSGTAKLRFGAPKTAAQLARVAPGCPEALRVLTQSFDGATFAWAWESKSVGSVSGGFTIPTVRRALDLSGPTPYELGENWPLVLDTRYGALVAVEGDDSFLGLFGKSTDFVKAESLEVMDVLRALTDHLALPGWELSLYEHDFDDEGEEDVLADCREQALAVRSALGLPIPKSRND